MRLGERVHLLLKKYSRSQKELADFLNTKTSTINGWKQTNRNPSSDMIVPICEFFNISTDYFLTGKDENIHLGTHKSSSDPVIEEQSFKYILPYKKKILELLKLNNKNIEDLAVFLNVNSSTVDSWIKGNSAPSCDCVYDICSFFKVEPSFLFGYAQGNPILTEEQIKLFNYYDKLDEFERNIIIGKISEMIYNQKTGQGTSSEFSEELTPDLSHNINLLDRVNK